MIFFSQGRDKVEMKKSKMGGFISKKPKKKKKARRRKKHGRSRLQRLGSDANSFFY